MGAHSLLEATPAIVFFDTTCLLCNRTVQILLKIDRKQQLKFAGLESDIGKELLNEFSITSDSVILYYKGDCYIKSKAFLVIAKRLGFPYNMLHILGVIPRKMADGLYDWIAKNRIKWFGKTDRCLIPENKYTDRIIL